MLNYTILHGQKQPIKHK